MPIIERKTLDRVNSEDILYLDAGNLIKAGHKVGSNTPTLASYNVSFITVIAPTKEERSHFLDDKVNLFIQEYIAKRKREQNDNLRFRLRDTLLSLHVPFREEDQSFSVPGKRNYLKDNDLLAKKLESLNYNQVEAGSSRLINKYKLKFAVDILSQYQSFYNSLKPMESDQKEAKGCMNRLHVNSIRLNSWYDDTRLRTMGDSLVNQSIDIALLYMHAFININKKRIIEGRPLSEARWDPKQRKTEKGIYQYKPEVILEASIGVLMHNIGNAHHSIHQIISDKPLLSSDSPQDQQKIKLIQKSINVLKHLMDRDDISSISKMICIMQKDFPDGTGYPSPNENRYLFEFVRLFQIIDFYDRMTNPVMTKTTFSRMDVINYLLSNSGEYNYSGEKFQPQPRFDSVLVNEFLDVLAPYEIKEKVYLFEKGKHNYPLFVGKVVSYPDSWFPLISILKDEKNGKEYRDGSVFMHVPSSSLYLKSDGKTERKKYPWIGNLEIFDKNVDAGDISEHEDIISGQVRPLYKKYKK